VTANPTLGRCGCNRIAMGALNCPCGAKFVYCSVCFQSRIRESFAHVADCDRAERAIEPAPRALVAAGVLS
jgi:hypothetical protein